MAYLQTLFFFFIFPSMIQSQQPYTGKSTTSCQIKDNSTSLFGYFCNTTTTYSCTTYLTFHSNPPYQSISSISTLLNTDPSSISPQNPLPNTKLLIIPTTCTCSAGFYQKNTSYTVQAGDTLFLIANNTYQGLSTCQALDAQNGISPDGVLVSGQTIRVPLRCACPSLEQRSQGFKYLLSYLVEWADTVGTISQRLGVDTTSVLDANGLSQNSNIYPFTTLLVPLLQEPNFSQILVPTHSSPPPFLSSPVTSKNHVSLFVGVGVGIGVVVVITLIGFFYPFRRRKQSEIQFAPPGFAAPKLSQSWPEKAFSGASDEVLLGISNIACALKEYRFVDLQHATNNFSERFRIDGSVYRGVFNGDIAAIKVMNRDVRNEIGILKNISHSNLIRLSGFCFHQSCWFLIFEYVENGPLDKLLFEESGSCVLTWIQRVQIALDVAYGLSYLHNYTILSYVHKDLNSSNILLDVNFRAKIANFGMARAAEGHEDEPVLTRHIVGTQGYMAPEYLEHGLITPGLDVFAFGVVMLEIVTGKKAVVARQMAKKFFELPLGSEEAEEELKRFVDPALGGNYHFESAFALARLISECSMVDVRVRPSMVEVVQFLSVILASSMSWSSSKGLEADQSLSGISSNN